VQEVSDLDRFGVELVAKRPNVVPVPGELRFEVVNPPGQDCFDDAKNTFQNL
jgi:hypothetical protein